jgi:hypothetical protein
LSLEQVDQHFNALLAGKTFILGAAKVYSGAEEWIDGPCADQAIAMIDVLMTLRGPYDDYGHNSQYLGPDGDHRDEQRQRGERSGFLIGL